MKLLKGFSGLALCALFGLAGVALAQTISVPQVVNVTGSADLVPLVVGGAPSAQTQYAKAGLIGGVEQFANGGTITGDPAYTFVNGVTLWTGHKSSTLTTGTFTTEANPTNGKRECVYLDQTTSTLTFTANTGQTIGTGVPAAGVANIAACIIYQASNATWYGSN